MTTLNTVEELKERLSQNNPSDVLLDVRTAGEFSSGHIKGAINLTVGSEEFFNKIESLDKSKTYITFCLSGNRSGMAAMMMAQKGLEVINSKVGFMHWKNAGATVSV
ncbi:MAG: rhodanese-like domain-containing protein [bacterium]